MSIVETKSGLQVKPLDNYFKNDPGGPLPQPAFVTLIVAPKGSGKTTLLLNMLSYYSKTFHKIYIFSATVRLDKKWEPYLARLDESKEKKVYEKFDSGVVEKLFRLKDEEKQNLNSLIIYDDMISDNKTFAKWSKNVITKSCFNARHYGISSIIVSQKFTEIPANLRNQCNNLIISRLSQTELQAVYESMTGLNNIPQDKFMILYRYATSEPFCFLNVDVVRTVLYKNFDKIEWKDKQMGRKVMLKRELEKEKRKEMKRLAKEILMNRGIDIASSLQ